MTRIEGGNVAKMILFNNIYMRYILTYCSLGLTMVSVIRVIYDQQYSYALLRIR